MRISDWSSDVCSSDLDRVDRMTEADHDFLLLDARLDVGFRFVRIVVALLDLERDFVGAAVLGTAQRTDAAADRRVHVGAGTGDNARGERRGIEDRKSTRLNSSH